MNEPYFQVGEEVILVTDVHPECCGDHFITDYAYDSFHDGSGGSGYCHAYELAGEEGWWHQAVLKKKHKPSTQSFSNLITNIEPTEA